MKVLHIIRREEDRLIEEIIDHYKAIGEASILLIQDGVLSRLKVDGAVYASINDVLARGVSVPYKLIGYPAMCQLIIEHDKVIVW